MRIGWAVTLTGLLLSSGCAFNEDYPATWPVWTGGGCPALSGTYSNFGERAEPLHVIAPSGTDLRPNLAERLFASNGASAELQQRLRRADRVLLSYSRDGVLTVDVREGNTSLAEMQLSQKNQTLKCTNEGAVIAERSGWAKGAGNPLIGRDYSSETLMPTSDGSLIIKASGGGTGLVYGVYPVSASQTSWLLWRRG